MTGAVLDAPPLRGIGAGADAAAAPPIPPEHRVAIVGGGPSAMYLLEAMADLERRGYRALPREIVVVERRAEFGVGLPYDPDVVLEDHNLAANEQVSRMEKGRELRLRFHRAVRELRRRGVVVTLLPSTSVEDVVPIPGGAFRLTLVPGSAVVAGVVVLAMGHWASRAEGADPEGHSCGPWPAAALQAASAGKARIAVLGTSLTAADVAVTVARAHGRFEALDGRFIYRPSHAAVPRITLMSRGGWLPRVAGYGVTAGFGVDDGRERFDHRLTPASVVRLRDAQGGFVRLHQVWRRLLADAERSGTVLPGVPPGRDPARVRLRADLARMEAAMADNRGLARFRRDAVVARGSIRSRTHIPWQALVWQKTNILRDCFGYYPAEDRLVWDRYATLLMAHQRPLNVANAERLLALVRAGMLEVARLGAGYSVERAPGSADPVRIRGAAGREWRADLLVSATGQTPDFADCADPLAAALLRRGLVAPRRVPFLNSDAAERAAGCPRTGRRVIRAGGQAWYDAGGIDVDRETCEVRSVRGREDGRGRLFALGPLTVGLFPISDGLHALHWLVPRIAREIALHVERTPHAAAAE
jgi:uncharacterized NAD(P)/FAD-binding protein YdhS